MPTFGVVAIPLGTTYATTIFHRKRCQPISLRNSYGKESREEAGKYRQNQKPGANQDEDPAPQSLDGWSVGAHRGGHPLARRSDDGRKRKDQGNHRQAGDNERENRGTKATDAERRAGQTGQDGAGSSKAGEYVAEAKQKEPWQRMLMAKGGLAAQRAMHGRLERAKLERHSVELDEAEEDENQADGGPN